MEINGSVAKNFESTKIAKSGQWPAASGFAGMFEWLFP